jgi:PQQ-dependent dehydrogenase (methanol/ethanol family)
MYPTGQDAPLAPRSILGRRTARALSAMLLLGACTRDEAPPRALDPAAPALPAGGSTGATAALEAEDGQWTRPAKSYSALRFSGLTEITAANVAGLRPVWTFSTSVLRGHEEAPIVVNNTMYILTPYPNLLYALDLTRPGAPQKWRYDPAPASAAQGVACCDVVNRGPSYANGLIVFNTLDNHVVAVDATTGVERWKTRVGDINIGETMTMAPLVVRNRVIVGNSGGEMGVRGWIKALDLGTGSVVWTAFNTGPDADVKIGPRFKPFYEKDRGTDLGVKSWPAQQWKIGGANVWGWISYDPTLNLIFHGTGNPGPWNPDQRPGDNKWSSTLFARDPDTGDAVWAYQISDHDLHDYDGVNENVLVDIPWKGRTRHVLLHPDRNGYVYMMDRATGEVLSAEPFGHITTSKGVDLVSGRLRYDSSKTSRIGEVVRDICPASPGAKDWQPSAFSPRTGLLYMGHQNLCQDVEGVQANYIAGTPYVGMNVRMKPGPGGHRGLFTAWNPVAGRIAWQIREDLPVWSGTLVTAGDVAFYGTMEGWFKAVDARTGKPLWQFKTGSGIISQPVTYRGPDGRQYVAVVSGVGGWAGAIVAGDLDPRDSTAALGMVAATADLPDKTTKGGTVYVFALH